MEIEAKAGPRFVSDGSNEKPWLGDGAAIVTQDIFGKFGQAARRGYIFSSSTALTGITLASTHVSPLAAGTGTPIVGIWNPPGSGVFAHVLRVKIWSISGTPGAGAFAWNGCASPGITVDGALGVNHKTFQQSSLCRVFSNTATTGSKVGVLVRGVGPSNFAAALAASAGPLFYEEYSEGDVSAVEGALVALAAPAAGTSWVVGASITWAEVPKAGGT